jgi:hypothetical protein
MRIFLETDVLAEVISVILSMGIVAVRFMIQLPFIESGPTWKVGI